MIQFIVAIAALLAPTRDVKLFSETLARVALLEPALYSNDVERKKTVSLMTAIAFRESSFVMSAKSKTNDYCWFQIHDRPEVAKDPDLCIRVAFAMLRESFRMCPEHPLAFYAEGPKGCRSVRGQRLSTDRISLAKWIIAKAEKEGL